MTTASVPATPASKRYRYLVVAVLAVVYTFNFMDRQIMSILAEPIRKELGLSDAQLGMLPGLAFARFYTFFGVAVAWAADRFKRVWTMAAACGIWSVFTAARGFAHAFTPLAVSRVLVCLGAAGRPPKADSGRLVEEWLCKG